MLSSYVYFDNKSAKLQYIPRNMHTVFALLCFVVVIHWLIFPYPSGLLHWHCGNLTIASVSAKQPWWIWIITSCEFIMNDCVTTTKQSTTKPCAYFLGYTVSYWISVYLMHASTCLGWFHNDVIKWKKNRHHWLFTREFNQSLVDSPHKGQWRGAVMISLICAWTNGLGNNRDEYNEYRCEGEYVHDNYVHGIPNVINSHIYVSSLKKTQCIFLCSPSPSVYIARIRWGWP